MAAGPPAANGALMHRAFEGHGRGIDLFFLGVVLGGFVVRFLAKAARRIHKL
jgi:hypothetical protein